MNDFDYDLPVLELLLSIGIAACIGICLAIAFVA